MNKMKVFLMMNKKKKVGMKIISMMKNLQWIKKMKKNNEKIEINENKEKMISQNQMKIRK